MDGMVGAVKARIRPAWAWASRHPATIALTVLAVGGYASLYFPLNDTQDDVRVIQRTVERSPCNFPASDKCQQIKRKADVEREPADTCIAFEQVVRPDALRRVTTCKDRGVVNPRSPTADQSVNGAPVDRSPDRFVPGVTNPGNSPDPGPSDTPPSGSNPGNPQPSNPPQPNPGGGTAPNPSPPAAPPASAPTIQLPPVSVDLNDGACVGVGGLAVGLNC